MVAPLPMSSVSSSRGIVRSPSVSRKPANRKGATGRFSHFSSVVKKDFEFLTKGLKWTTQTLQVPPRLRKVANDFVWLRYLEDVSSYSFTPPRWPKLRYPELSGVEMLMADLKTLESYARFVRSFSKWRLKPLPEVYDPQAVSDYFILRPHVLLLRLVEVAWAFCFATLKSRDSEVRNQADSSSKDDTESSSKHRFGMILKETLLNLGPTFIKVGQSLSTRPDIIGSQIAEALSELHENIPPFPREVAIQILEEEFCSPVDSVFSYISEETVGAASFGQVYRGRTVDGLSVAVKVQRPDLQHFVTRDIFLLRLGLGLLKKVAKRKSDLRLYADELGKGFIGELDYTLEAANASKFREVHSPFPVMYVPKVYLPLTWKRVLTMEWVDGDNPSDLLSILKTSPNTSYSEDQKLEAKRRLLSTVSNGVEASLVQLLETGLMHADPHPGNLRYMASDQLGFLDFGLLCQMEKKHRIAMLSTIVHIVNGDWPFLVHSLIEMDIVRPESNIANVTAELENTLGVIEFKNGIPDVMFSKVLSKIWSVALKYHFRMPPYFILVLRSLASLEGLAIATDPKFKTFESAYPYVVKKLLKEDTAQTRKLLHSVLLNKDKEFRWERFSLFLQVGLTRNRAINTSSSSNDRLYDAAYLILRLLPSQDGLVVRRLLMSADGTSFVRAMVSKEASNVREQFCRVIADILYKWMVGATGSTILGSDSSLLASDSTLSYESLVRDRRLKVIYSKILNSAGKDPILMLKFYMNAIVILGVSLALACQRFVISSWKSYGSSLSHSPRNVVYYA